MNEIILKNNKIISLRATVLFYKDEVEDIVVADCPSLNLASSGVDIKEAKKAFNECFSLWIEGVNEDCQVKVVLQELGWDVTDEKATENNNNAVNLSVMERSEFVINNPMPAWAV